MRLDGSGQARAPPGPSQERVTLVVMTDVVGAALGVARAMEERVSQPGVRVEGSGNPRFRISFKGGFTMRCTASGLVLALALSASAALAQTTKPDVSGAPSAQSSGAGIAGQPGNKNGPAAKPGETVGASSSSNQQNPTVQHQDTSNIKGLPGNKSGPPAKEPDRK